MRFIIGGRVLDLHSLGTFVDAAFKELYSAYFGHQTLNWTDFQSASMQFFSANSGSIYAHDSYFANFTPIWNNFLSLGNYDEAERIWDMALSAAISWESTNAPNLIHKGTPYYFWGMTVILRGDIDRGYALMHRAVEEDIRTSGQRIPDTPAFAFATINYAKTSQAFRQWVLMQADYLNTKLNKYTAQYGSQLSLGEFRNRFLTAPQSTDIVSLFAYTIARLMRISTLPSHVLQSRFAGQFEANLLFDILLVIDSAIKAKNPGKRYFIDHAEFLTLRAGHSLTNKQLQDINSAYKYNFEKTLQDMIEGTFNLPDGTTPSRLQLDVAIAYGIRNYGAHDISAIPTIWLRFNNIEQILMNVIFMAVDFLY